MPEIPASPVQVASTASPSSPNSPRHGTKPRAQKGRIGLSLFHSEPPVHTPNHSAFATLPRQCKLSIH